MAQQNANDQGTDIDFYALDFLDPTQWTKLGPTDLLISNPPYIPQQEAEKLAPHVREQEPHLALFVPNEDPLLFYKALARFSTQHLSPLGALYVEIHEDLGQNVVNLMKGYFETAILRQDLNGRDRMVKCFGLK
ncbi:MAG: hypothetical protein EAZ62_07575 [Sphingobacteriia bacterium]|nr:MAG: hypothetical protein EAZ62_07575 [Sphingobacteriia bacterium]